MTKTKADLGYEPFCHYWDKLGKTCTAQCTGTNEYGDCTGHICTDGNPLPADYDGLFSDCGVFTPTMMKNFKITKYCPNKAYAGGCLPNIKGSDTVKKEQNPDSNPNPNGGMSENSLKNNKAVYVLSDGTILIHTSSASFTMDINGHKKPNKWGYDIFGFIYTGNKNGITKIQPYSSIIEKGGISSQAMYDAAFK